MTFGGLRLGWLLRRWWVMVAAVLGVVAIALIVARPAPVTYTAESVLLVRSGATESQPGSANEANRLAVTYAELVPQDTEIINAVGSSLGISRDAAKDGISAKNDDNTSILRVRFTGKDANVAVAGSRAIAAAMVGANPVATNFRGVALSNLPDTATRNKPNDTTLPTAMLLGVLLGALLIIAVERSRGRIDAVDDLERELGCPVTSLQGMQAGSISALLKHWSKAGLWGPYQPMLDLRGDEDGYSSSLDADYDDSTTTVALVTGRPGQRYLSQEVASVFASTAKLDESLDLDGRVVLRHGGAPGTQEVGERIVEDADLVVLIVSEGTPVATLRNTMTSLVDFGSQPRWVLFAPDSVTRRAGKHHGNGEDSEAVIDGSRDSLGK